MNTFSIVLLVSSIYFVSAENDGCGGCADGLSCQVIFTATVLHNTYKYRECVKDGQNVVPEELLQSSQNDAPERLRRNIFRPCTSETVAVDCGKDRCCLGNKICSPLLPKYIPCNLKNVHKCDCREGLVCRITYSLKIPVIGITLDLKQCMEPDENGEVKEGEMTEN